MSHLPAPQNAKVAMTVRLPKSLMVAATELAHDLRIARAELIRRALASSIEHCRRQRLLNAKY